MINLEYVKKEYIKYNGILFLNKLLPVYKINFILDTDMEFCMGYSKYEETPLQNGEIHTIAISGLYELTDKQITEILIHEMIHLWQLICVKEDRYKKCTNIIAHDRVFIGKMNTINILLRKMGYPYEIKEVYSDKLIPIKK